MKLLNGLSVFVVCLFSLFASSQEDNIKTYSHMKAVIVVGPSETSSDAEYDKMSGIIEELEKRNVEVIKLYNDKAHWDDVVEEARGAHFFVYSGHGSNLGENGGAGGLCLNDERNIPSSKIAEELELAPNAVVIFKSVCNGAGSSASDDDEISQQEAINRVESYSSTFFKVGAGAYYANNVGNGCQKFLKYFFEENSLEECFKKVQIMSDIEVTKASSTGEDHYIGLGIMDWGGYATKITITNGKRTVSKVKNHKSYDVAFVGPKDFTIDQVGKP